MIQPNEIYMSCFLETGQFGNSANIKLISLLHKHVPTSISVYKMEDTNCGKEMPTPLAK